MKCSNCGDAYGEAVDVDDRRWRTLCDCERRVACHRCKQPSTHAFLDDDGEVDRYACDKHGVTKADREGVATVHGVKVTPAQEASTKTRAEKTSGGVLVHIACRCGKCVFEGRNPTNEDRLKALSALKNCSVCRPGGRKSA